MSGYDRVFDRLSGVVEQRKAGSWKALCPCHADTRPSLAIDVASDDGRLLLLCGAGCSNAAIIDRLGLEWKDLFPMSDAKEIAAIYSYTDESGNELYQAIRYAPKDFRQRVKKPGGDFEWSTKGVRHVPYRLPQLIGSGNRMVLIVEGEKDVETLVAAGFVATTNVGGAGKWRKEYSEFLRGRVVAILPDNDDPGRKHAQQVVEMLNGIAKSVRIIELPGLPDKGDVSDWLSSGHTVDELKSLIAGKKKPPSTAAETPPATPTSRGAASPVEILALLAIAREGGKYAEAAEGLLRDERALGVNP